MRRDLLKIFSSITAGAARFLNESTLGFLALIAFSLGLAPYLFDVPRRIGPGLDVANWIIIGLFALEYAVSISLSADRWAFARDPWRILDALIIAAPLASLLLTTSHAIFSTPMLRILRLICILLFGTRAVHGLKQVPVLHARPHSEGRPQVMILASNQTQARKSNWDELMQWMAAPTSDWVQVWNLTPERLVEVASAAGVSHAMVEVALQESSFPRIESGARWTALTMSLPAAGVDSRREPVLLLIAANGVLSISLHALDLQLAPAEADSLPWAPHCVFQILRLVLARNEEFAGRMERVVRELEELPVIDSPESFFRQTFRLKRMLSTAKGDLWRLRGLLEMLADGRRMLPNLDRDQRKSFSSLFDEADFLYQTVDNIRESVLSLIELHIDIAAHDTNRFMRLLAMVTTLVSIPAVVGSLLGMNLVEAPWPVTLGQVAFGTLVLALGVLYTFMAKGWLR